jgi:hypothetical protein
VCHHRKEWSSIIAYDEEAIEKARQDKLKQEAATKAGTENSSTDANASATAASAEKSASNSDGDKKSK